MRKVYMRTVIVSLSHFLLSISSITRYTVAYVSSQCLSFKICKAFSFLLAQFSRGKSERLEIRVSRVQIWLRRKDYFSGYKCPENKCFGRDFQTVFPNYSISDSSNKPILNKKAPEQTLIGVSMF